MSRLTPVEADSFDPSPFVEIGRLLAELARLSESEVIREAISGEHYIDKVARLQEKLAAAELSESLFESQGQLAEKANDLDAVAIRIKRSADNPNRKPFPAEEVQQAVKEMCSAATVLHEFINSEARRMKLFATRNFNGLEPGRLIGEAYYIFGLPDRLVPRPPNEVDSHLRAAARCLAVGFNHAGAACTFMATESFVRYYCNCLDVSVKETDAWGDLNSKLSGEQKSHEALLKRLNSLKVWRDNTLHGRHVVGLREAESIQKQCAKLVKDLLEDLVKQGKARIVETEELQSEELPGAPVV